MGYLTMKQNLHKWYEARTVTKNSQFIIKRKCFKMSKLPSLAEIVSPTVLIYMSEEYTFTSLFSILWLTIGVHILKKTDHV